MNAIMQRIMKQGAGSVLALLALNMPAAEPGYDHLVEGSDGDSFDSPAQ